MRILLATLFCLVGQSALAAPLVVRSGDHEDFTRVVIETRGIQGWTASQSGRRVAISPPEDIDGYDLARLYDRITRERLANAVSDGNRLILELACDCEVSVVETRDRLAVLDISETQPTQAARALPGVEVEENWNDSLDNLASIFDLQLPSENAAETTTDVLLAEPPQSEFSSNISLGTRQGSNSIAERQLGLTEPRTALRQGIADENREDENSDLADSLQLNALQQRLAEQIGSAATRGILAPALTESSGTKGSSSDANLADTKPSERRPDPSENIIPPGRNQLHRSTSQKHNLAGDYTCDNASDFAVHEWGGDLTFQEAIAKYRNSLFGEFDQLNHESQIALAKTYVYYGFGAEAISILELGKNHSEHVGAIRVIAEILAEQSPTQSLKGTENCNSDIAMWAILANKYETENLTSDSDAALQALNKLPIHLRQKLAPLLSEAYRHSGNLAAAELSLRFLKRNSAPMASDARMEAVQMAMSSGESNEIGADLDNLLGENTPESPLALVKFIDLSVKNGTPISAETALLAAAYSRELAKSKHGEALKRAHALALAKNGEFGAALEEISKISATASELAIDTIFQILTAEAEEITFLNYSLSMDESKFHNLAPGTLKMIGERLLNLGFPEEALKYTASIEEEALSSDIALLNAKAYSQLNALELVLQKSSDSEQLELQEVVEEAERRQEARETITSLVEMPIFAASSEIENAPASIPPNVTLEETQTDVSSREEGGNQSVPDTVSLQDVSNVLANTEILADEISRLMEDQSTQPVEK